MNCQQIKIQPARFRLKNCNFQSEPTTVSSGQVNSVADLLDYTQEDLLEKKFCQKSAEEVIEALQKRLESPCRMKVENNITLTISYASSLSCQQTR